MGVWTHLLGTYEPNSHKMSLYVNGKLEGTADATLWNAPGPFVVGAAKWGGTCFDRLPGTIDHVQVWDRTLSAVEAASQNNFAVLRAHYNLGAALFESARYAEAREAYAVALAPIERSLAAGEAVEAVYATAYNNLGAIHLRTAAPEQALDAYVKAARLDPSQAATHYNVGFLEYGFGRHEAAEAAHRLGGHVAVKVQVQAGGRGKGGGVALVHSPQEAADAARRMLDGGFKGMKVTRVLVERLVDIAAQYYAAISMDRSVGSYLAMVSNEGGVDIEETARTNPDAIRSFHVDAMLGLRTYHARRLVGHLPPEAREGSADAPLLCPPSQARAPAPPSVAATPASWPDRAVPAAIRTRRTRRGTVRGRLRARRGRGWGRPDCGLGRCRVPVKGGAVGLTQILVWIATSLLMLEYRTSVLGFLGAAARPLSLPHVTLGTGVLLVVYFVLGYLLYAALFAMVGAMVSSEQEAQQAQIPVVMLLVISIMFLQTVLSAPDGRVAQTLGLLPFSSTIVMPLRMSAVDVPPWEIFLSLVALAASCYVAVYFAAYVYRTGLLMYGKRITIREIVRWARQ